MQWTQHSFEILFQNARTVTESEWVAVPWRACALARDPDRVVCAARVLGGGGGGCVGVGDTLTTPFCNFVRCTSMSAALDVDRPVVV